MQTGTGESLTIALVDLQYNCMKATMTFINAQWARKP